MMRKHIVGATALLVVALLGGCKDAPAVQPQPSPVSADPGAEAGLTAPPKAGTDAVQPSGAQAGGAEGAAAQPSGEAPATPKVPVAIEAAKPSTSTGSKSKAELPKAELPRLDEPAAKQQATAPMLEPPKATGSASPSSEAGDGGSKPATAPMPADLVTPPMAGTSSSASDGASSSTSAAAKAEALYKNNCMVCHGDKLQGDVGPNLTKVGSRQTKEQLLALINQGSKSMPPFQKTLKTEQIEALAGWLTTQK